MSGPNYSRETFAPSEPTFAGDDPHSAGHNGTPPENVDETRPRTSFGVPGIGPAGGFEAHPIGSPPPRSMDEPGPSSDRHDGFGPPTLGGGPMQGSSGPAPPPGATEVTGYAAPLPSLGEAPTAFTPGLGDGSGLRDRPPNFDGSSFDGPGFDGRGFAGPGFERPGFGSGFDPPRFDGSGPPGSGYGEPTVGMAGIPGAPMAGMAGVPGAPTVGAPHAGQPPMGRPPMGPPGAGGPPTSARSRPQQRARGPRRAKLQLRHINPWTVLKFSCVLSVALFFVWLITIGLLYGILQAAGVINNINDAATTISGNGSKDPVTPGLVFGGSAIIGVINVVLFIALSTVGSVVYNLCADLVGGIEVTLSERD